MTDRGRGAEGDVVLRDGATAHVRPVRPDDEPSLLAFIQGLSDRSRWLRFFSAGADLERAARESSRVDADRFALVATAGRSGVVIGHGGYVRTQPDRAEVAFAVADDHQARGLATTMLGWLAAAAEDDGIATFTASVLPDNHRMLEVFRDSGFPVQVRSYPGELAIEMPSSLTPQARQRFEQRERLAAAAAVRAVLEPRSVAVIGASDRPGAVGAALWANLRRADFTGALHAVNRRGKTLDGAPCTARSATFPARSTSRWSRCRRRTWPGSPPNVPPRACAPWCHRRRAALPGVARQSPRFARIARRVARRKPILAVRGGRTPAGGRAAGSHTGALLAASDVTVDGLFQQAGVVRADTLGELFDVAALLASQPLPRGRATAILTNAGGPAILCADACVAHDLELATLHETTVNRLEAHLPEAAVLANPVDMLGTATPTTTVVRWRRSRATSRWTP